MTQESLKNAIAAAQQRLESLLQRATEDNSTELLQEAIAGLSHSLEELQVAAEEREIQNCELISTREALEAERQRYLDLFNFTPDGYLVTDAAGIIQAANPAAAQLLNVDVSRLVGKPLAVFVHPQQRQQFRQILTQLKQQEQIRETQVWMFHEQRKIDFPAELTGAVMRDSQRKLVSLCFLVRDISDRQQAQEKLAQSENLVRAIIESQPECVKLLAQDGTLLSINPAGLAIIEAESLAQVQSRSFYHFVISDYCPAFQALTERVFQGESGKLEFEIVGLKGTRRWLETHAVPFHNTNGKIVSCLSVTRDISDRKRLELALQESEAQLRDILNNAIASIVSIRAFADGTWEYDYYSPSCEAIFGFTAAEMMAGIWWSRIPPEDQQLIIIPAQQYIFAEQLTRMEYRFLHKDGTLRWICSDISSRWDKENRCFRVIAVDIDISDRKIAEDKLAKISTALSYAVEGISYLDTQGRYVTVNQAYAHMVGYSPAEMVGMLWYPTVHPEDLEMMQAAYQRMLSDGKVEVEARGVRKDGSMFYKQLVMVAAYDDRQQLTGHYCFMKDISDRKQAEFALQKQFQQQQALNRVMQAIRNSLDLTAIFNTATAEFAQLFSAAGSYIVQYLSEHKVWQIVAEYHQDSQIPDTIGFEIPDEANPIVDRLKQLEVVQVSDTNTLEDEVNREIAKIFPGSWLMIPLKVGGTVWGSLNLYRYETVDSDSANSQIELALAVADQVAIAIQQANLYQQLQQELTERQQAQIQLQKQAQQKELLNQVIQGIRSSLDLNVIFQTATTEFAQLLSAEESYITQYLPEQQIWRVVAGYRQNPEIPEKIGSEMPHTENFITGKLKQREIVQISDTSVLEDRVHKQIAQIYPGAWLIVPLIVGESLWGCFSLIDYQTTTIWNDEQVELARAVADQLAIAIQQANLYQQLQQELIERQQAQIQLQRQAQQKEVLNRVIQTIRNSLDLNAIFQTAMAEFAQLFTAAESYITQYVPEQQIWRVVAGSQPNSEMTNHIGLEIPDSENFVAAKLKKLEIVQISDADILPDRVNQELAQIFPGSWLIVPLICSESVWGSLSLLDSPSNSIWDDYRVELARAVADQLAIAIQQANLYQQLQQELIERQQAQIQLQKQAQQKELLNRVIQGIRNSLDLNVIFQNATTEFAQLLSAEESYITQYFPERQIWRVVGGYRQNPEIPDKTGLEIPHVDNPVNAKLQNLEIFQVSDTNTLENENNQEVAQLFPGSWLVLPLTVGNSLWGCLSLIDSQSNTIWDDNQIELARAVADQIGIAIQQANLYQQLEQELSDRKQAEIELQKAKEAAETANVAKSTFLANMSHELRTPLNAILGFTQMMARDRALSAQQQEQVKIINNAGDHLLALINDILEMSKIEAGRISFNPTSFDLIHLLLTLEELFKLKAESKGLQLKFELAPDLPQYIQTDEGKLRQVLINILGNAIKFTDKGQVILRVQQTKQPEPSNYQLPITNYQLNFEIEDTGPGINEQEIERIFDPFTQSESGKKVIQGTGLGLAISRKFVQMMGGDIRVNSQPNQGSLFIFDIQVTPTESIDNNPKTPHQIIGLAPNQPEYRILVVDDHPESRLLLVTLLSSIGFQVNQTSNGQEAVSIWSTWKPHLICMDIRMPIMDGIQATAQIRAKEKDFSEASAITDRQLPIPAYPTKIVALTANAFDEDKNAALAAGCDDYISKPLQQDIVLQKIGQYLEISYLYEAKRELNETHNQNPDSTKLTINEIKKSLVKMPEEWRSTLHNNAYIGDDSIIFELIAQIPPEDAQLAKALIDLTNNFEFDKIIDLTQK